MYREIKVIGRGSFSVVWLGKSNTEDKLVAIKKINTLSMTGKEDLVKEKLNHINVISYITSYMIGDELNLVLELAEHGDLKTQIEDLIKKRVLLTEKSVCKNALQICSGLKHMHLNKIMHRDLKPANIFINKQGVFKLGDLGLSCFFGDDTINAKTKLGTPYYMSPERLRGEPYSYSSDIWSLGCVLYEMAALQSPFNDVKHDIYRLTLFVVNGEYMPIPSPIYGWRYRNIVDKCLLPKQQDRPTLSEIENEINMYQ